MPDASSLGALAQRHAGGPMSAAARIVYSEPTQTMCVYGNVIFSCARAPATVRAVEACHRASLELAAQYPQGYCQITIAAGGIAMPSPEVRERMRPLLDDLREHIRAIAYVFEGSGLWMSSMRVLTHGMMLAMPSKFPQRIFARPDEAVPWAVNVMGKDAAFDGPGLLSVIESARALDPKP